LASCQRLSETELEYIVKSTQCYLILPLFI